MFASYSIYQTNFFSAAMMFVYTYRIKPSSSNHVKYERIKVVYNQAMCYRPVASLDLKSF